MPIYEYRCDACGHEEEFIQKVSAVPLTTCPACSEPELKKLISAAGFRLKGGGWYETDFKSGNQKNLHGDKESSKSTGDKPAAGAASAGDGAKPAGDGGGAKTSAPKPASGDKGGSTAK